MYQRWVHCLMVHGLIYAVFALHLMCTQWFPLLLCPLLCALFACTYIPCHSGRRWAAALTVLVFQITTAATTATKPAAVTPAQVLSLSVTAAAASRTTGPATGIMTAATTATRPTPTAPIKVSVSAPPSAEGESSGSCSEICHRRNQTAFVITAQSELWEVRCCNITF